ncbi:MAG: ABC transporter ATP-binding protein [Candidatus Dormibacteraeota bacterium]|nr:ABC transporter ATP-binding protein [Candidatus Dormibacteraeota bacterium]
MLSVEHLGKSFGPMVAIKELNFEVREREFLSVVGPSGCGKTTLLRCVAGILPLSSGRVIVKGKLVTGPPEQMALVFQEYGRSLFPWLTVERNVRLPLVRKRLAEPERRRLVEDSLVAVGLAEFGGHFPWQLSGGMQQRVAIARALAYQPQVLLMDEPFASVDAQTRAELEDLLLRVWQEFGVTILFVTHDIDEAVYLGDRVLVLTPRPTEVQEIVEANLPRPRDQLATKELPEFARLRAHVYRSIKAGGR